MIVVAGAVIEDLDDVWSIQNGISMVHLLAYTTVFRYAHASAKRRNNMNFRVLLHLAKARAYNGSRP